MIRTFAGHILFESARFIGFDGNPSHRGVKPRFRVKAGRRVISMEESFMSGSQWRPNENQLAYMKRVPPLKFNSARFFVKAP